LAVKINDRPVQSGIASLKYVVSTRCYGECRRGAIAHEPSIEQIAWWQLDQVEASALTLVICEQARRRDQLASGTEPLIAASCCLWMLMIGAWSGSSGRGASSERKHSLAVLAMTTFVAFALQELIKRALRSEE